MHVSLPCSFSPTTHQLWIELNAEIPKNPNNNDRWKHSANAETALAWSEHTNQKILREILWISEQGKIGSGEAQDGKAFPSWTFRQFVCFPIQPLCFRWNDERIIETDADAKTDMNDQLMNVDFHIWIGTKKADLIAHIDSSMQKVKKLGHRQHENYNILFQQRHVDEIRTTNRQKQQNFRTRPCTRIALTCRETMSPKKSRRQRSQETMRHKTKKTFPHYLHEWHNWRDIAHTREIRKQTCPETFQKGTFIDERRIMS